MVSFVEALLLLSEEGKKERGKKKKRKPLKSNLNKEELCCKAETSACAPEESIKLSEENNKGKPK